MPLNDAEFESWRSGLDPVQGAISAEIRSLVLRGAPQLTESVNTSRWLSGYLFYGAEPGGMVFALGAVGGGSVAFHAMPWYGSPELRARYHAELSPFVAGKSCFHFGDPGAVPREALAGLVAATDRFLALARKRGARDG